MLGSQTEGQSRKSSKTSVSTAAAGIPERDPLRAKDHAQLQDKGNTHTQSKEKYQPARIKMIHL